jgi:GntR family transcriptional regulator
VSSVSAFAIRSDYPEPLWIQAVDVIRREVENGNLPHGSRLPPERELCLQLNISRATLRKALTALVEAEFLRPSHGRGWYIGRPAVRKEWPSSLESFTETAARMGLTAESLVLRCEFCPANLDEAEQLGIAPGAPLFQLVRVRLLGGIPVALDSTSIPGALVGDIARHDFRVDSLYGALASAGLEPARADSTIEAQEADDAIAAHLGVNRGTPMLILRQLAVDHDGRPLFSSTVNYAGERYRLRTSFARATARTA